jgi:hypothetical protein
MATESDVSLPPLKPPAPASSAPGYDNAAMVATPGQEKPPPGGDEDDEFHVVETEDLDELEEVEGERA